MPAQKITNTFNELCDITKLQIIHDNWDDIPIDPKSKESYTINSKVYNPKKIIAAFIHAYKMGVGHKTSYKNSSKAQTHGRQYAVDGVSMQGLSKAIVHTVLGVIYDDIDMKMHTRSSSCNTALRKGMRAIPYAITLKTAMHASPKSPTTTRSPRSL